MRKALIVGSSFVGGAVAAVLGVAALATHVYRDSETHLESGVDLGPAPRPWVESRINGSRSVPRSTFPRVLYR